MPTESKRGSTAQWIAQRIEVAAPQKSIFTITFFNKLKLVKCNTVANITQMQLRTIIFAG